MESSGKSVEPTECNLPTRLREFDKVHIGEDCSLLSGCHENSLFFDCTFTNLNGLTLKDCDLNHSRFTTETIRDALGFTLTLGCHSFKGVEFSPLLFDLMLCLLTMSKGNDGKRRQLIDVIGAKRYEALMRVLNVVE